MNRVPVIALLIGLAAAVAPASAQLATPTEWKWVTDTPAELVTQQAVPEGGWRFVAMPPGWHVTMGPGGVLYEPSYRADDRFAVEAEIFLFPSPDNVGYGVFLGGQNLESATRSYIAFLARGDGSAGIFHYDGTTAQPVVAWSKHEAVLAGKPNGTSKNVIRVEAERDSVVFKVNGGVITTLARADLAVAGHVGFRVDGGVNLHASNLDITYRLAPTPPAKD